jgi:hypothetical protein
MANINAPVCILLKINVVIGADIIRVSMNPVENVIDYRPLHTRKRRRRRYK